MTEKQIKTELLKELSSLNCIWGLGLSSDKMDIMVVCWYEITFTMLKISKIKDISLYYKGVDHICHEGVDHFWPKFHLYINDKILLTVF